MDTTTAVAEYIASTYRAEYRTLYAGRMAQYPTGYEQIAAKAVAGMEAHPNGVDLVAIRAEVEAEVRAAEDAKAQAEYEARRRYAIGRSRAYRASRKVAG